MGFFKKKKNQQLACIQTQYQYETWLNLAQLEHEYKQATLTQAKLEQPKVKRAKLEQAI